MYSHFAKFNIHLLFMLRLLGIWSSHWNSCEDIHFIIPNIKTHSTCKLKGTLSACLSVSTIFKAWPFNIAICRANIPYWKSQSCVKSSLSFLVVYLPTIQMKLIVLNSASSFVVKMVAQLVKQEEKASRKDKTSIHRGCFIGNDNELSIAPTCIWGPFGFSLVRVVF